MTATLSAIAASKALMGNGIHPLLRSWHPGTLQKVTKRVTFLGERKPHHVIAAFEAGENDIRRKTRHNKLRWEPRANFCNGFAQNSISSSPTILIMMSPVENNSAGRGKPRMKAAAHMRVVRRTEISKSRRQSLPQPTTGFDVENQSGRQDLNLRLPGPKPGALAKLSYAPWWLRYDSGLGRGWLFSVTQIPLNLEGRDTVMGSEFARESVLRWEFWRFFD